MNRRKLNKVFAEIKEKSKMDYAITNTDYYGDCNSCVNSELAIEFGEQSTGIYVKHWLKGMNAGSPWSELDGVYIGHDITEEQANVMVELLKANGYDVQPTQYDTSKAFFIKEV